MVKNEIIKITFIGEKYEGEFRSFLKHGNGIEKFINGDTYTGNYVNGKPDGFGEYQWANGSHYKGMFKNGLRHGQGIWKKNGNNSDIFEGEWVNDKKCGLGLYRWESGNYYQGNYFDDLRHGYGEMHWNDGSAYYGAWEKGIQHGEGQLVIPGKEIKKGIFKNNLLIDEANTTEEDDTSSKPENSNSKSFRSTMEFFPLKFDQKGKFISPRRASYQKDLKPISDHTDHNEIMLPNIRAFRVNINDIQVKSNTRTHQRSTSISFKSHKQPNGLLTKKEMIQWIKYQGLIKQLPNKLQDIHNPDICKQIRYLINPNNQPFEKKFNF